MMKMRDGTLRSKTHKIDRMAVIYNESASFCFGIFISCGINPNGTCWSPYLSLISDTISSHRSAVISASAKALSSHPFLPEPLPQMGYTLSISGSYSGQPDHAR
jgi:hypothetical protein